MYFDFGQLRFSSGSKQDKAVYFDFGQLAFRADQKRQSCVFSVWPAALFQQTKQDRAVYFHLGHVVRFDAVEMILSFEVQQLPLFVTCKKESVNVIMCNLFFMLELIFIGYRSKSEQTTH